MGIQGQNPALTVLYVPYSLGSGTLKAHRTTVASWLGWFLESEVCPLRDKTLGLWGIEHIPHHRCKLVQLNGHLVAAEEIVAANNFFDKDHLQYMVIPCSI